MSAAPLQASNEGKDQEKKAKEPAPYKPTRAERLEEKALRGTKRQKASANFWLQAQANLDWWKSVTEPPAKPKPAAPPAYEEHERFAHSTPFSSSFPNGSEPPGGRNYAPLPAPPSGQPGGPAPWSAFRASSSFSPSAAASPSTSSTGPTGPTPSSPAPTPTPADGAFVPSSWRSQVAARSWQKPAAPPPPWAETAVTEIPAEVLYPQPTVASDVTLHPLRVPRSDAPPSDSTGPHRRLASGHAPPPHSKLKIAVSPGSAHDSPPAAPTKQDKVSDAVAKLSEAVAKVTNGAAPKASPIEQESPASAPAAGARKPKAAAKTKPKAKTAQLKGVPEAVPADVASPADEAPLTDVASPAAEAPPVDVPSLAEEAPSTDATPLADVPTIHQEAAPLSKVPTVEVPKPRRPSMAKAPTAEPPQIAPANPVTETPEPAADVPEMPTPSRVIARRLSPAARAAEPTRTRESTPAARRTPPTPLAPEATPEADPALGTETDIEPYLEIETDTDTMAEADTTPVLPAFRRFVSPPRTAPVAPPKRFMATRTTSPLKNEERASARLNGHAEPKPNKARRPKGQNEEPATVDPVDDTEAEWLEDDDDDSVVDPPRSDRRRWVPRPTRQRWPSPIDLLETPTAEWSSDDEDRFSRFVLSASRLKRARRPGTEETLELAITVDNEERAWSVWQEGAIDPDIQVAQLDADLSPPSGFLSRFAGNSRRSPRGPESRTRAR